METINNSNAPKAPTNLDDVQYQLLELLRALSMDGLICLKTAILFLGRKEVDFYETVIAKFSFEMANDYYSVVVYAGDKVSLSRGRGYYRNIVKGVTNRATFERYLEMFL